LKLQCHEPLSNFAFKFNVRRYSMAALVAGEPEVAKEFTLAVHDTITVD
jgi:hypothetical protein